MSNLTQTRYKLPHSPFLKNAFPPQKSPRNSPYILTQGDEELHKQSIKSTNYLANYVHSGAVGRGSALQAERS
jgi:hypothetical protein